MKGMRIDPGKLQGEVAVPGSKSAAHRALIAAALANGPTVFSGLAPSEDIEATLRCLVTLGAQWDGQTMHPIQPKKSAILHCGESGTTLRFMLPLACALGVPSLFLGRGRLADRPIEPLLRTLRENGAQIPEASLPFSVSGRLTSGHFTATGDVTSQYISGLLLVLPLLESGGHVSITTALSSQDYVQMTIDTMEAFKLLVIARDDGYFVPGSQRYISPGTYTLPGDWSSAAVWLTAGAMGGEVTVHNLPMASHQADRHIVTLLSAFGANVTQGANSVRVCGGSLRGQNINVSQCPDLFPLLSVLGAVSTGRTVLRGTARLRHKESDRVQGVLSLLDAFDIPAKAEEDVFTIEGGHPVRGAEIDDLGDHRLVMAAAILAACADGPSTFSGVDAVAKSYPDFFAAFSQLGGHANGLDLR